MRWVDVPDLDARATPTCRQFEDRAITRSRKLEGQWWGHGGAYFVASYARTSDGSAIEHDGQVRFYDPRTETVRLHTLFGVNPDPAADTGNYDGPDNITVSPYGGLILAEDGDGINHLIGVAPDGSVRSHETSSTTASSAGRRSAATGAHCTSTSSRRV